MLKTDFVAIPERLSSNKLCPQRSAEPVSPCTVEMQGEEVTVCGTVLYFVLWHTHHRRTSKKQNVLNSAVCPRYNPISTAAVTALSASEEDVYFKHKKPLCSFTEKPPIFFISSKDLWIEQQMLAMKQKEPPASQLWLTEIFPSQKGREMLTQTLLYVPVLRPCCSSIRSFHIHRDQYGPRWDLQKFTRPQPSCGLLPSCSSRGRLTESYASQNPHSSWRVVTLLPRWLG